MAEDFFKNMSRYTRRNAILELPKTEPVPVPVLVPVLVNKKKYSFSTAKISILPPPSPSISRRQAFINIHRRHRMNQIISGLYE